MSDDAAAYVLTRAKDGNAFVAKIGISDADLEVVGGQIMYQGAEVVDVIAVVTANALPKAHRGPN